jgi:glycosyltransferase involved in cell wall biosynthesis
MLDNALARAIIKRGNECLLVPLYTPIRTDEEDISVDRVFFGGINIFLQEKLPFLKWLPRWLDAPLNNPSFVRLATRNVGKTPKKLFGELTLSILDGTHGKLRKEANHLIKWITGEVKPAHIIFSNLMIGGVLPDLRESSDAHLWVTLQGDDAFLDYLTEAHLAKVVDKMSHLVKFVDGFIVHSHDYATRMAKLFSIPQDKMLIVPLGIETKTYASSGLEPENADSRSNEPLKVGYLARLSREKGLHNLVQAFTETANHHDLADSRLHIAGYLGPQNRDFWRSQQELLTKAGLQERYKYHGSVDLRGKIDLLRHIDLLCVPTEYQEPKGLFVLEAVAAGTPYLLPNHGAFPEMHRRLQFGWLFEAGNPNDLADKLRNIGANTKKPKHIFDAQRGHHKELLAEIDIQTMASRTLDVLNSSARIAK